MKFAGLAAVCLSLSLTGFYFSYIHTKKMKILSLLSHFFSDFSAFIKMYSLDTAGSIARMRESGRFSSLGFLSEIADNFTYGCNMKRLWENAVRSSGVLFYLDKNTSGYILNFSDVFSKNSRDELFLKCEEYAEVFRIHTEREEKKWEKNRSFVPVSGVIAAALILLIFI